MYYRYLTFFASGIFIVLSNLQYLELSFLQAPGIMTIKYLYSKDDLYGQMSMFSIIKSSIDDRTYYQKTDLFSLNSDNHFETQFSFEIHNISEILKFRGNLSMTNYNGEKLNYEINEIKIEYNLKNTVTINNTLYISKSLYSKDYSKELEFFLSVKCKKHFYPENQCTVMCLEDDITEKCDSKGNKICKKGFFLNKTSGNCENDWCWLSANGCKNNGKCINNKNKLSCICGPTYTGTYCENYKDLCKEYKCPNNTICKIEDEKINCVISTSKKNTKGDFTNVISARTLISISGFSLVFIITIAITVWACNNSISSKYKYRSRETSIHSTHTYYPNNSLSKGSKYCYHCDQESHRFLNTYHSLYGNKAYYSLKHPNNRLPHTISRAYSDLILSYGDRFPSTNTVSGNEDSLPLPPPIESHEEEIML